MLSDAAAFYIHFWIFFSGFCFGAGSTLALAIYRLVRFSRRDVGPG